jgi:hypothetical protein
MTEVPVDLDLEDEKYDLVLIATHENNEQESYLAWAAACMQDPNSNRPIVGQIVNH